jgi:hypothetical protein
MGHTTASRDGSPKPRHSNPSINDSDKVPSLVRSIFGSRVCIASLKAGTNPPPDRLRSSRWGVAACPSGIPSVPSRIQYLKDWEVSEHCDILSSSPSSTTEYRIANGKSKTLSERARSS